MKAPDKIYVRDFGNSLCLTWTSIKGKKHNDVDIEYIRKDALLEWLNKMLFKTANALDFRANCVYGKVIDQLNSM